MQQIPLAVHGVLVAIVLWRMWHLLSTLLAGVASERDLLEVGIDGVAIAFCGGILTGLGLAAAAVSGIGAGSVFFVLGMLGLTRSETSKDELNLSEEDSEEGT